MTAPQYPGFRLTDEVEMLRRVAPGGKCQTADGVPGADAFKPRREETKADPASSAFQPRARGSHDQGGLSTKRQAEAPDAAYWAYLRAANPPGTRWAMGTWGFQVGQSDTLGLPAYDDAGTDEFHPEHHATVWFPMPQQSAMSNRDLRLRHERIAEDLRTFALEHGCLYRPNNPWNDALSLQITTE